MVVLRLLVKEVEGLKSSQVMQTSTLIFPPDSYAVEMEGRDVYPNHEKFQAYSSVRLSEV